MSTKEEGDLRVGDSAANAPDQVLRWAKKITDKQGCEGHLRREKHGYHLYIPCPECLHTHGARELTDPKYSINISILCELGDAYGRSVSSVWMPGGEYEDAQIRKRKEYGAGICMRTRSSRHPHRIPLSELISMGTITSRHPDIHTKASIVGSVSSDDRESHWELDQESGQMCPPPPGETVSMDSLPMDHPAVEYLTRRGYEIQKLSEQFKLKFCTREYPVGENGIYYRKMPGGWKDTPQHRVIFHAMIGGAPLTWQARLIEKVSDDGLDRYMLHPYSGGFYPGDDLGRALAAFGAEKYTGEAQMSRDDKRGGFWLHRWSHVATRPNPAAEWIMLSPFDELRDGRPRFQPSKYRTAKYSSREMMGWDAAVSAADASRDNLRWAVLCEGPLDAARVGPGGVALIGSSISPVNAKKVAENFHIVFMGFDSDRAGKSATEKITPMLQDKRHKSPILNHVLNMPIPSGKDLGDLRQEEYNTMFNRLRKRANRLF